MNSNKTFTDGFFVGAMASLIVFLTAHACSQPKAHAQSNSYYDTSKDFQHTYSVESQSQYSEFDMQDEIFLDYAEQVELESGVSRDINHGRIHTEHLHVQDLDMIEQMELDRARRHYNELHDNNY